MGYKGGIDEIVFDVLIEEDIQRVSVGERGVVRGQVRSDGDDPLPILEFILRQAAVFGQGIDEFNLPPGAFEADFMISILQIFLPQDLFAHLCDEFFRKFNHVPVVSVGLVELQHRKLRIVL